MQKQNRRERVYHETIEQTCLRGICDRNGRYIACSHFYFCMMQQNPKSFAGTATFLQSITSKTHSRKNAGNKKETYTHAES